MPVTVVVRSASLAEGMGKGDAPSLTFDGPRVVLGRGAGSDVRLPDPSVSLRHATIRATGAEYAIVDEGSTNGTWVGGVKLVPQTPRLVKAGDLVRLGRVWVELAIGHKPATPDLGLATRDLALALVRRAMDAVGDDTTTKVRVAEGPDLGAELRLGEEGRAYVIGRAETCALPLADADASREHASVVRRGGQVFLRDLGAKNGVFLGDARLAPDREVVWRNTTMARIGQTVLALDEPVSVALAELEAADDERLREEVAPPPPPPSTSVPPPSHGPPASAAPASEMGVAAPIADVAAAAAPVPRPKARRFWTLTDLVVVALALSVIFASLAGLVWVLR
jgi:pSer/pThr/pTyr-binding forkhead associated (FHA) protein